MSAFLRQILLPDFGVAGQEKLSRASVLVVGAGGLGCPVLLYLAAAGLGRIGIVDGDIVSESNLNRQVLYGPGDIGLPKGGTAARRLSEQYPATRFEALPFFLNVENALETIACFDVVVDGSDNFPTRYMVNDACFLLQKPLIQGAIYQYEGQVAVFDAQRGRTTYRDLYPVPPDAEQAPNCSETGVLGVLPGIIGLLQAAETIKCITGVGLPLLDKALFYHFKNTAFFEVEIAPHPDAQAMMPADETSFRAMHYVDACERVQDILWTEALALLERRPETLLLDIREEEEGPDVHIRSRRQPMSRLLLDASELASDVPLVLFCRSGVRSRYLAGVLQKSGRHTQVYSIEGGLQHPLSPLNHRITHG